MEEANINWKLLRPGQVQGSVKVSTLAKRNQVPRGQGHASLPLDAAHSGCTVGMSDTRRSCARRQLQRRAQKIIPSTRASLTTRQAV